MTTSIRGIVLAAGDSTRMGAPKALLTDRAGRTFVARVLHTLCAAGLPDLTVVTGSLHGRIVAAVAGDAPPSSTIRFARNHEPSRGQLSSLLVGLDAAAAPGVEAVMITLVDVPFVGEATVRSVLERFGATGAPIVRPARRGRHGHPVLFARPIFEDLSRADPAVGAKAVVRAHADEIVNVEVEDEGAFLDLDTMEDYERIVGRG